MEKTERYRRSIMRCWSSVKINIHSLEIYLSDFEPILSVASEDIVLILNEFSALGRGDAGREVDRLLELLGLPLVAEEASAMQLRFPILLRDALVSAPDADEWRYEANEVLSEYLRLFRYAAQSIGAVSLYPSKVAECFNEYLLHAQDILCRAELQVTLRELPVREYKTEDTYLESVPAFLMGFEARCRELGMDLQRYGLEMIEDTIRTRFNQGGIVDSRFIDWLFARAIRHQAERLTEEPGNAREITSMDIAAAWPDY